ncbi:MAG: hypothetical protein LAP38_13290 [Acidobacteriia bacterium]|nr:hypothetical protein [Terriglobia bacterium]
MAIRILAILLALSLALAAQRPTTRPKASDYPAHYRLSSMEIGAEFLPDGMPGGKSEFAGREYLVVEVAVFPILRTGVQVSKSQFTLHVNGSSVALRALSPGTATVAAVQPESSPHGGSVALGGPPLKSSSSSESRDSQSKMPRSPISLDPSETSGHQPGSAAGLEGTVTRPAAGYLLFRFDGDARSIRSLDLEYDGGGTRKARLRLL